MREDDFRKERDEVRKHQQELAKQREAEAQEAAEPRVYVVQRGDSLSKIAKDVLGDASRWKEIFEANKDRIKDPNLIRPGQELRIPGVEETAEKAPPSPEKPAAARIEGEQQERL